MKSVCQTNIQALRLLLPVSHSVDLGHLDRGRGGGVQRFPSTCAQG